MRARGNARVKRGLRIRAHQIEPQAGTDVRLSSHPSTSTAAMKMQSADRHLRNTVPLPMFDSGST